MRTKARGSLDCEARKESWTVLYTGRRIVLCPQRVRQTQIWERIEHVQSNADMQ